MRVKLFERAEGDVFRAGQPVVGKLEYVIDKPRTFVTIDVFLVGKGTCFWQESATRYHRNEEQYVSTSKNVLKGETVEAGTYEHQYEFLLPKDIPSSITTKHCTIKYSVIAEFVEANLTNNTKNFDIEIPVRGYVNSCSQQPLVFKLKQEDGTRTSNNGMRVKIEIEKTFVAPGEDIKLNVMIKNDPDNPIKYIKSELIKQLTCSSDTGVTIIERGPVKNTKGLSPRLKAETESKHTCIVPTMPKSCSIQNSKILKGEYIVRVTAQYPFFKPNASVEIPVVIGERRELNKVEILPSCSRLLDNSDSDVYGHDAPVVKLI